MQELFQNIKNKFPYLPEEKLAEILAGGEIVMLEAGEKFVSIGETSTKVAYVVEGLMRNYTINSVGEEVTVHFAAEMQAIAPYTAVFLHRPATETTEAVERSILVVLDLHAFKQNARHDPMLLRLYADMIESTLIDAIQRIEDFTQKKPEQRYQRVLDTQAYLIDRAPLKYLASYLGITPVSLSRIRKRLSQSRS
jgi:CRP-like cAMP-binding protein